MAGKTMNAGQICLAPDYVLAPQDQMNTFVDEAKKAVTAMFPTIKDNPDYTAVIADLPLRADHGLCRRRHGLKERKSSRSIRRARISASRNIARYRRQ